MQTPTQAIDWVPNSNFIRVLRCTGAVVEETDDGRFYWEGNVCVPEHIGYRSNQVVVLDAGPECKELRQDLVREAHERGDPIRLWIKEGIGGLERISGEEFAVREDNEGVIKLALQEKADA